MSEGWMSPQALGEIIKLQGQVVLALRRFNTAATAAAAADPLLYGVFMEEMMATLDEALEALAELRDVLQSALNDLAGVK